MSRVGIIVVAFPIGIFLLCELHQYWSFPKNSNQGTNLIENHLPNCQFFL